MKKYLILLLLLIPIAVYAGSVCSVNHPAAVGGVLVPDIVCSVSGLASGVSCDDCSGDLRGAWHAEAEDITSGDPCGCVDSAGDTTFAEGGDSGVELSGTQKSDGTYSIHVSGAQDYYTVDVASSDWINTDELKITFDLWIVTWADLANVLDAEQPTGSNIFYIRFKDVATNELIEAVHGGNAQATDTVHVIPTQGEFVSVEVKLKAAVEGNDFYMHDGTNTDEDDDDLAAFSVQPTTLIIGNNTDVVCEYYLDNIKIYATSGY